MDLDNNPLVLLVRKHLVEHLGPPTAVFEFSGSPVPNSPITGLNVALFTPGGPQGPAVYATSGASLFRMKDGRRVEALVVLNRPAPEDRNPAIHRLLGSFSFFAESNNEVVLPGDVVRAADELAPICRMDAVLFVPPITFQPSFHRVGVNEQEAIDLIWLLPIYAPEAEYSLQQGPEALMMLFTAQQLDLTDPDRPPADTQMSPEQAAEIAQRLANDASARAPRRQQPSGRSTNEAKAPSASPSPRAAPRRGPSRGPARPRPNTVRPRRPGSRQKPEEDDIRFDLSKDGAPIRNRPVKTKRSTDPKPPPPPPPPPEEPKLTKAERVAALKKAAREARARAKARQEASGNAPAPATAPPNAGAGRPPTKPNRPQVPFRRTGASGEAEGEAARAGRRRGSPFRRGPAPTSGDGEGS